MKFLTQVSQVNDDEENIKKWFSQIKTSSFYFGDGSSRDELCNNLNLEWNVKNALSLSLTLCKEDKYNRNKNY